MKRFVTNHIAQLKSCFVAMLMMCGVISAHAQTDAQFTQYYQVPTYYNPAAVGQTDFIKLRGGGRLQWVGIDNAPKSFLVTADSPFKVLGKRIGAGVVLFQESIGLYRTFSLDAQLGYKLRKFGGEFTFALSVGMYDQSFRGSEVILPDDDDYHQGTDDGIPTQDLHGTAFDLGAGVWYQHKWFWAGVSCTHITSPAIKLNSDAGDASSNRDYEFNVGRTLYFMAGSNIPIKNTLFEVMPSLLVKSDFTFTTAEITARLRYNHFLQFGIGYRWDDAVCAMIAAEFKNFYLGYSFDYPTSTLARASAGSHEVFLGYQLKLDLGDKNRNRHKAIRIM